MIENRYKNILVIVVGFWVLGEIFGSNILYNIAVIIGILSLISKFFLTKFLWLWQKLIFALGWFNSRILLSVIFFVFLTPISLLYRLFNKDPLKLKKPIKSNYHDRGNHLFSKSDLENPW